MQIGYIQFHPLSSKFKSSADTHWAKSKLSPWEKYSWKRLVCPCPRCWAISGCEEEDCVCRVQMYSLCERRRGERMGFGVGEDKVIPWNLSDLEINWHLPPGHPVELCSKASPCHVGEVWWLVLNTPACSGFRVRMKEATFLGVPVVVQWVKNPTTIHEDAGLIPCPAQWIKGLALPQASA